MSNLMQDNSLNIIEYEQKIIELNNQIKSKENEYLIEINHIKNESDANNTLYNDKISELNNTIKEKDLINIEIIKKMKDEMTNKYYILSLFI
jgi:hypothetical protein